MADANPKTISIQAGSSPSLLGIPVEIRLFIYEYVSRLMFRDETREDGWARVHLQAEFKSRDELQLYKKRPYRNRQGAPRRLSILATCRLIHNEAVPVFYADIQLVVTLRNPLTWNILTTEQATPEEKVRRGLYESGSYDWFAGGRDFPTRVKNLVDYAGTVEQPYLYGWCHEDSGRRPVIIPQPALIRRTTIAESSTEYTHAWLERHLHEFQAGEQTEMLPSCNSVKILNLLGWGQGAVDRPAGTQLSLRVGSSHVGNDEAWRMLVRERSDNRNAGIGVEIAIPYWMENFSERLPEADWEKIRALRAELLRTASIKVTWRTRP